MKCKVCLARFIYSDCLSKQCLLITFGFCLFFKFGFSFLTNVISTGASEQGIQIKSQQDCCFKIQGNTIVICTVNNKTSHTLIKICNFSRIWKIDSSQICFLRMLTYSCLHLKLFNKGPNSTSPPFFLELGKKKKKNHILQGVWIISLWAECILCIDNA